MTVTVFIGYDVRDHRAFRVCEASLQGKASDRVRVLPLLDHECRRRDGYARPYKVEPNGQMVDLVDHKPFSTAFTFTRFLVPYITGFKDELVVFCDADMLWRADVYDLIQYCRDDEARAVWCVRHDHVPAESTKMDGVIQSPYPRKNWSSLVVWNPSRNQFLTPARVNELPGAYLHAFTWLEDEEIGPLPEHWNHLVGHSQCANPSVAHFTNGSPDMPGHENDPYAAEWFKAYRSKGETELERAVFS